MDRDVGPVTPATIAAAKTAAQRERRVYWAVWLAHQDGVQFAQATCADQRIYLECADVAMAAVAAKKGLAL